MFSESESGEEGRPHPAQPPTAPTRRARPRASRRWKERDALTVRGERAATQRYGPRGAGKGRAAAEAPRAGPGRAVSRGRRPQPLRLRPLRARQVLGAENWDFVGQLKTRTSHLARKDPALSSPDRAGIAIF